jgi:hypothetical protein
MAHRGSKCNAAVVRTPEPDARRHPDGRPQALDGVLAAGIADPLKRLEIYRNNTFSSLTEGADDHLPGHREPRRCAVLSLCRRRLHPRPSAARAAAGRLWRRFPAFLARFPPRPGALSRRRGAPRMGRLLGRSGPRGRACQPGHHEAPVRTSANGARPSAVAALPRVALAGRCPVGRQPDRPGHAPVRTDAPADPPAASPSRRFGGDRGADAGRLRLPAGARRRLAGGDGGKPAPSGAIPCSTSLPSCSACSAMAW